MAGDRCRTRRRRAAAIPPTNTLNMSVDGGGGGGAEGGVCTCMYEGTSDQWQFPSPPLQRAAADGEGVWASGMSHTHNELACCAIQYAHARTRSHTRTGRHARIKKKQTKKNRRGKQKRIQQSGLAVIKTVNSSAREMKQSLAGVFTANGFCHISRK